MTVSGLWWEETKTELRKSQAGERILNRRAAIKLGTFSLVGSRFEAISRALDANTVTERQKGDPDASYETVTFDPASIRSLVSGSGKAVFERWEPNLPLAMIATARTFLGKSRETSPDDISDFLRLFKLPLKNEKGYVAFCAAGVSFCALLAYVNALSISYEPTTQAKTFRKYMPDLENYYFYPTVSCVDMYHIAAGKHRWIDYKPSTVIPRPGWIVLYDWASSGTPDHCGLVFRASAQKLFTVEFNTSGKAGGSQRDGGTVSEKERDYTHVKGFVVTDRDPSKPS